MSSCQNHLDKVILTGTSAFHLLFHLFKKVKKKLSHTYSGNSVPPDVEIFKKYVNSL